MTMIYNFFLFLLSTTRTKTKAKQKKKRRERNIDDTDFGAMARYLASETFR